MERLLDDGVMIEAGITVKTGLSIGVALFPRDASKPEALLRKAQLASMEARRRAERVVVYNDSLAGQVLQSGKLGAAFEPQSGTDGHRAAF